jgi:hypothetical protein
MRNTYAILAEKYEGTRPLGRSTLEWDYNIEVDLKEIKCEDVD